MTEDENGNLVALDKRCGTLAALIEEVISERGSNMPYAAIVGVLECIKFSLLSRAQNED